jgi:hypothetical protein
VRIDARQHLIDALGEANLPSEAGIALRQNANFSWQIKMICPVQSYFQKYFLSRLTQITSELTPSRPTKGAYRDRHGRGMGCGGRWCAADEQHWRGRRSRVVLTPRRWRQVGGKFPLATVTTSPITEESPKETVKTIA